MIEQSFSLIPFPAPYTPALSLTGTLFLQKKLLSLHYSVEGEIERVLLPLVSPNPSRKDELWKATCLEFFLAIKGQPGYWEFNMSPSGDWNVYRMDAYRRIGFREETTISQLPFEFRKEAGRYFLDVPVDLSPVIPTEQALQIGITAIIQTKDGRESYWALVHPATHADFHLRESFILEPAAQIHPSAGSARDG
ncbi:MAG: DOMON-like domain-containing protein [Anaerolineales bacterium]